MRELLAIVGDSAFKQGGAWVIHGQVLVVLGDLGWEYPCLGVGYAVFTSI